MSLKGLKKRGESLFLNKEYRKRIESELEVIFKMGFESYFLVVFDYVKFAKKNNIIVGPGRGSVAGSLVAFCLGITEVDPIKYGLLFERFLNPNRKNMPDIDIDFQDNKRDLIIKYLKEKYGEKSVANIVSFSSLSTKQVLRDVGRVYGFTRYDLDKLSSACGNTTNSTLEGLYNSSKVFKNLIDSDEKFTEVYNVAKKIENLPRQTSIHAAGIVLSDDLIVNYMPVFKDSSKNLVVQYDMDYVEFFGLLKMDIFGLKNLTIIDECFKKIKDLHGEEISISSIDIEDHKIYDYIRKGNVSGIFQLESKGMINTIKKVKPTSFQDLSAILALYRPGPMDFIDSFAKRKNNEEKIEYIDNILKDILKETYGIIVYQEQIMQLVGKYALFSLADGDILRRAISKKNKDDISKLEKSFIKGAIKNNKEEKQAKEVFELILKFSNYGFNKAHSVSYAMISSIMIYIKMNYPAIFFSSVMNSFVGGQNDKFVSYVIECRENNIKLLLPSVNFSKEKFYPKDKNNIYYSLSHIKGINNKLIKEILEERKEGLFKSYVDFTLRMIKKNISKTQFDCLVNSGCLDEFSINRETMKENFEKLYKFFMLAKQEVKGQIKLDLNFMSTPLLTKHEESGEKLSLEYELLGIFISGFPLEENREKLRKENYLSILEIINTKEYSFKTILMIQSKKIIKTKKNRQMAICSCVDESGEIEVVIFPQLYEKKSSLLNKGSFIKIIANFKNDKNISIIANDIYEYKEEEK